MKIYRSNFTYNFLLRCMEATTPKRVSTVLKRKHHSSFSGSITVLWMVRRQKFACNSSLMYYKLVRRDCVQFSRNMRKALLLLKIQEVVMIIDHTKSAVMSGKWWNSTGNRFPMANHIIVLARAQGNTLRTLS
uniref:Uncharacterized protein n=1 Tax=Cacopsylla melanoneura TaxID=428564 RepID=A0A8D8QCN4_9HEMI